MNFLRTYSYTVHRYCLYNGINSVIRRCSHTVDKQEYDVPPRTIKSTIYPDYKVIYNFPYIKHASILNKLKRNYIIFVGTSIPVIGTLKMQDFMSMQDSMCAVATSLIIITAMHFICLLCNNLIGIIYLKEDDQKVIISYLNYWGKRIDLLTDVNDVTIRKTTSKIAYLYRTLHIKSRKKNFKIFIKFGNIIEKSNFHDILNNIK